MAGLGGGSTGGAIRAGKAFVEMFMEDNKVFRGLDRLQSRFNSFGSFLRKSGVGALGAGLGLATPIALAVGAFANFDDAIRATGAVSGATADELASMTERAKLLGRTTSFTAVEVAKLMGELGRAGFKPQEIEEMTASVLDLARATGTDAALSAEILSNTLRQFALNASDATRVADALTATANKSNASVESLGETLKEAGTGMADLGASVEDTLALAGALANVGIKGTQAGTALRRLGITLAAESGKVESVFGVASKDAAGNARPIIDVMEDIFKASEKMASGDRAEAFNDVFGLLAITSASALSKGNQSVRELRAALQDASGTAARTAQEMDAGIGGAWRRLKSGAEGVAISVGEALSPALQQVAEWLGYIAAGITNFTNENREVVVAIAATAAGLIAGGAALIAFGLILSSAGTIIGTVVAAFKLVAAGILFLTTPLGLATAALGGLIYLFSQSEQGKAAIGELGKAFESMGQSFTVAWDGIVAAVKAGKLELAFKIASAGIRVIWAQLMKGLRGSWNSFVDFLADSIDKHPWLVPLVGAAAGGVVGGIPGAVGGAAVGTGLVLNKGDLTGALRGGLKTDMTAAGRLVTAAQAELNRLVAEAKVPAAAPGGDNVAADAIAADRKRFLAEMKKRYALADNVAGGFTSTSARQQFGYSPNSFEAKTAKNTEITAEGVAAIKKVVEQFPSLLRFK